MKKIITIFFLLTILFNMMVVPAYGITPTDLQSRSAILINADDGTVLFEKSANDKMQPASITKIMLLVLISERGSQIYLEAYETQTVENMLKAISMRSANDASVAMAEFMYGSVESCVKAMNDRAKELGMNDTIFTNVTGLPDPNHLTTAKDIATMTQELFKHNYVNKYVISKC